MSQVWTEYVMRVGLSDEEGVFIEVSPDESGLSIRLGCPNQASKAWCVPFDVCVSLEMARALAEALVVVADRMEAKP